MLNGPIYLEMRIDQFWVYTHALLILFCLPHRNFIWKVQECQNRITTFSKHQEVEETFPSKSRTFNFKG